MSRPAPRRASVAARRSAVLSGAGSLSITGTGRVNKLVNAIMRDDPFARDARNLRGDFDRALSAERRRQSQ